MLLRLFWVTLALALAAALVVGLWSMPEGAVVWPWQLSQAVEAGPVALDPVRRRVGMRSDIHET